MQSEAEVRALNPAGEEPAQAPGSENEKLSRKRLRAPGISEILGFGLLILALGTILYYIWGPSAAFIHSDSTDTIIWARSSLEAGRMFDPDFSYAALLPFGANLWYMPLLAAGGYTLKVQLWGLTVFLLLFAGAIYFMFRGLPWTRGGSAAAAGLSLLLFSGSEKLREIFWGHVIYYSLGLLFLALGLGLLFRIRGRADKRLLFLILLGLLAAGAMTDGVQIAAVWLLPLLGGLFFELLASDGFEEWDLLWRRNAAHMLFLILCSIPGALLLLIMRRGGIQAGYAEAYSQWSKSADWAEHFRKIVPDFLNLAGAELRDGSVHMVSIRSIALMLLIVFSLIILFYPWISLFRWRRIKSENTRLLLLVHAVNSFLILFLYVFGKLAAANWRLIPLMGTGLWTSLALLGDEVCEAYRKKSGRGRLLWAKPGPRFAALALALLLMASAVPWYRMVSLKPDHIKDFSREQNIAFMEKENLEYGFGTFWNANVYELLTDGRIKIRDINVNENGVSRRIYQNKASWFEPQDGIDTYFLLLSDGEYQKLLESREWPSLEPLMQREETIGNFHFLIFGSELLAHLAN